MMLHNLIWTSDTVCAVRQHRCFLERNNLPTVELAGLTSYGTSLFGRTPQVVTDHVLQSPICGIPDCVFFVGFRLFRPCTLRPLTMLAQWLRHKSLGFAWIYVHTTVAKLYDGDIECTHVRPHGNPAMLGDSCPEQFMTTLCEFQRIWQKAHIHHRDWLTPVTQRFTHRYPLTYRLCFATLSPPSPSFNAPVMGNGIHRIR